jgi:hypothetical protein
MVVFGMGGGVLEVLLEIVLLISLGLWGSSGGGPLVESLVSGGREVRLGLPSTDASKDGTVSSIGISNEEQILWSKVGKEVLGTKSAEIGQDQCHIRRCDSTELIHSRKLMSKSDYFSDLEREVDKGSEEDISDDYMEGSKQDAQHCGPGVSKVDMNFQRNRPEPMHDPLVGGFHKLFEEIKDGKNTSGDGSLRTWKLRVRSSYLAQEPRKPCHLIELNLSSR